MIRQFQNVFQTTRLHNASNWTVRAEHQCKQLQLSFRNIGVADEKECSDVLAADSLSSSTTVITIHNLYALMHKIINGQFMHHINAQPICPNAEMY